MSLLITLQNFARDTENIDLSGRVKYRSHVASSVVCLGNCCEEGNTGWCLVWDCKSAERWVRKAALRGTLELLAGFYKRNRARTQVTQVKHPPRASSWKFLVGTYPTASQTQCLLRLCARDTSPASPQPRPWNMTLADAARRLKREVGENLNQDDRIGQSRN